jgi:hypothetical protein
LTSGSSTTELLDGWLLTIFVVKSPATAAARGISRDAVLLEGTDAAQRLYDKRYRQSYEFAIGYVLRKQMPMLCFIVTHSTIVASKSELSAVSPAKLTRPDQGASVRPHTILTVALGDHCRTMDVEDRTISAHAI